MNANHSTSIDKTETKAPQPNLAAAAELSNSENPANSSQFPANQQNPPWTEAGQARTTPGQGWTNPGQTKPTPGQPLPEAGHIGTPPSDPPPGSKSDPEPSSPESILAAVEDPKRDEIELGDMLDGFVTDRDRLAEISSVLNHRTIKGPRINLLTPEQQDLVYNLLQLHSARAVSKLLALPPPVGLNFRISKSALCSYKISHAADREKRRTAERLKVIEEIIDAENGETAFNTAAERVLKLRFLQAANESGEDLDALVTTFVKFRKLTLVERKQASDEQSARHRSERPSIEQPVS